MKIPLELLEYWANSADPLVLPLLTTVYESTDIVARDEALWTGLMWFETPDRTTWRWVQSLLPILSSHNDPLVPTILSHLSLFSRAAKLAERYPDCAENATAVLTQVRAGYLDYLRFFQTRGDLRSVVGFLLTQCSDRASEYLPSMLKEYRNLADPVEKARLLSDLGGVRDEIVGWQPLLSEAIYADGRMPLKFVAATEYLALGNDPLDPQLIDIVIGTSEKEVEFFWSGLTRALSGLLREQRIELLVHLLEHEETNGASMMFAKLLLESVYGELGVISPTFDSVYKPNRFLEFHWFGTPRLEDLVLPVKDEVDWLGVLVNTHSLWLDPYQSVPDQAVRTNLYELFGLPPTHDGLLRLWRATRGRRGDRED